MMDSGSIRASAEVITKDSVNIIKLELMRFEL